MDTKQIHIDFAPQQIVCLEAIATPATCPIRRLYSSVIQFIERQQNYWLRPLCLVEQQNDQILKVISLHRTSDVIIAPQKLREAWDTEILEFWSALYDESGEYDDNLAGRAVLHHFLQEFSW